MKTIEELWKKLENIELVQVRPVEMEALYKHCFEFNSPFIVEIGSAHGASSIILAEAADELNGALICIDHFPEFYYGQDKFGDYGRQAFKKNIKGYKNVVHIDKPSSEAVENVKQAMNDLERGINVLFVDGDHDYEGVKKDIELYLPLVERGGYVGFHDYYNPAFGVRKAVDENLGGGYEGPIQYWDLAVFKKL